LDSGSTPLAAEVGGLQLAFLVAAAISLTASLVALFALPRGKAEAVVAPMTDGGGHAAETDYTASAA
jgi:hypothetical protein